MSTLNRFPKLAARNVWRNKARSAVTLGAIILGVAVLTLLKGFMAGMSQMMVDDVVKGRTGALQIHRAGYMDNIDASPLKLSMPYSKEFMDKALAVEGVTGISGRLQFSGMVGNGKSQTMVVARGLDLEHEKQACPNSGMEVRDGAALAPGDQNQALIGYELAQSFHATTPDMKKALASNSDAVDIVNVQTASPEGRANSLDLTVKGLSASNFPFENKRVVTLPLQTAQTLVGLEGKVTEYAVAVTDSDQVDAVAARLRAALGADYEVHTWREVQPFVRDIINRQNFMLALLGFVLFVIVLTVIINTLLMTVFERVREIGTMMAVGVKRWQVLWLFVLEAAVIGVVGGTLGAVIGRAILFAIAINGIPMKLAGTSGKSLLIPFVSTQFVIGAVGVSIFGALVAAAYPAWRASRLNPVEALRST
jgi:putative ABC transport system permease protein